METGTSNNESIPKQSWLIAAITGTGAFMAMLDSTVVNLAIESIRVDLESSLSVVQWVSTGYLCALAVSLPMAAWLGVRYGYGRVWKASLACFIAASILCALSTSSTTLIAARALQGLAGGLMVPASQAVVGANVKEEHLGRIFGWIGLAVALGPALGPGLAGVLLESASWRWLFWINVPIGLLALLFARERVPDGTANSRRELDRLGLALLSIGLPLLLLGPTEIALSGISTVPSLTTAIGAALIIGFGVSALRTSEPLIDISLLRRRIFTAAILVSGLTGAAMYAGLLLIPLFLQLVLDQSPMQAGFWMLVLGMGSALALPVSGTLVDRYGAGIVSLLGALILLLGTAPFIMFSVFSPLLLGAILVLRGVGLAMAQMPAMTAAYASVDDDEMGDATTMVNIVQRLGGALGAIGVVIILENGAQDSDHTAYTAAFGFLLLLSCLAFFLAAMMYLIDRRNAS